MNRGKAKVRVNTRAVTGGVRDSAASAGKRASKRAGKPPATVLQIVPELSAGGAEQSCIEIVAALHKAGARALVATSGGRMLDALEQAGGEWLPFAAATKNPLRMIYNAFALKELCIQQGVSLIHARSRAPAWSARAAARMLGIPFVTTYHGAFSQTGMLKGGYNSVMASGDVVIANSDYTAGLVRARHGTPDDRLVVVHRGVDAGLYDARHIAKARLLALRAQWGLGPEPVRIIVQAARLTGWKGQEVTIEAMRRLRERGIGDVVCILAGDDQGRGAYRKRLADLITAYGLGAMVRLPGHCADMPAAFALADLALVPSTEPEAFGRAGVEAQAAGCPVIVSDLGAAAETVLAPPQAEPGRHGGWRITPGDAGALADAMALALALAPGDLRQVGLRGRAHAREKFALSGMQRATLAVYDRLLGTSLAARFDAS